MIGRVMVPMMTVVPVMPHIGMPRGMICRSHHGTRPMGRGLGHRGHDQRQKHQRCGHPPEETVDPYHDPAMHRPKPAPRK